MKHKELARAVGVFAVTHLSMTGCMEQMEAPELEMTSQAATTFTSTMKVLSTGRCADIGGDHVSTGIQLQEYTCNGGTNQSFTFVPTGSNYQIKSVRSGLCLTVRGNSTADNAVIEQNTCRSGTNQQFTLVGDGPEFFVKAANSGKCMDVGANTRLVVQWTCGTTTKTNQQFTIGGFTSGGAQGKTAKVAVWNLKNGNGVYNLPGYSGTCPWTITAGASTGQGWTSSAIKNELTTKVRNDTQVVAFVANDWGQAANRGTLTEIRNHLGWSAMTGSYVQQGIVARHGFLDTGTTQLVYRPMDTSGVLQNVYVVRAKVKASSTDTVGFYVFGTYWEVQRGDHPELDNIAAAVGDYMNETTGAAVLMGDLNAWNHAAPPWKKPYGTGLTECADIAVAATANPFTRFNGYGFVNAFTLSGTSTHYTGGINKYYCTSTGAPFKRIDHSISRGMTPTAITYMGEVPAGQCAPSDHVGMVITYHY